MSKLTPYTAPHKPHWKLSEILAQHAGKQNWSLTVVDDAHLKAQYISMAPSESTPTKFYADNPAWWVVQDGQIRLVYVPKGRYHRASFGGQGTATRLAINGYPDGLHNYQTPE